MKVFDDKDVDNNGSGNNGDVVHRGSIKDVDGLMRGDTVEGADTGRACDADVMLQKLFGEQLIDLSIVLLISTNM